MNSPEGQPNHHGAERGQHEVEDERRVPDAVMPAPHERVQEGGDAEAEDDPGLSSDQIHIARHHRGAGNGKIKDRDLEYSGRLY